MNAREIRLHSTFSVNWNKRDKVWKTLIHFKSDVFAAVAVVDAKTPLYGFGRRLYGWNFCSWLFFFNWRVFLRLPRFSTLLKNQLDQGSWRKTKNNEVDMQPIWSLKHCQWNMKILHNTFPFFVPLLLWQSWMRWRFLSAFTEMQACFFDNVFQTHV